MLYHANNKECKKTFILFHRKGKKKHNFANEFLVKRCLKITDKEEECVNDRNYFLTLRGLGGDS